MKIKYCLPIIKKNKKEVLKALKIKGYHFYEVWLDYIVDLDDDFLIKTSKLYKDKLILVFRKQNLEKIKISLSRRLEIIKLLSKESILFDLDFLSQSEEVEFSKANLENAKIILSYHDYKQTGSLDYLKNLINKMDRYDPAMVKIATFCKKESDNLVLLNLILELKQRGLIYIVLGMGEKGAITRIFGPLWGNVITFAPFSLKEKSAKGQLTKKSLELIFKEIN